MRAAQPNFSSTMAARVPAEVIEEPIVVPKEVANDEEVKAAVEAFDDAADIAEKERAEADAAAAAAYAAEEKAR